MECEKCAVWMVSCDDCENERAATDSNSHLIDGLYRTLLERALSLLTDEQVAEVFDGIDIEANSVPVDDQLRRIAELVKDVAV